MHTYTYGQGDILHKIANNVHKNYHVIKSCLYTSLDFNKRRCE